MSPTNGHANDPTNIPTPAVQRPIASTRTAARNRELIAHLEVPFHPSVIEWRVVNTRKNQKPIRGQVVPYADQRTYTDRLNRLFTPAGWTRKYRVHTSANFERRKDQKTVAKVFVTCELSIVGLGAHSARRRMDRRRERRHFGGSRGIQARCRLFWTGPLSLLLRRSVG